MKKNRFNYYVSIAGNEEIQSRLTGNSEEISVTIPLDILLELTLDMLVDGVAFDYGDEELISKIRDYIR